MAVNFCAVAIPRDWLYIANGIFTHLEGCYIVYKKVDPLK